VTASPREFDYVVVGGGTAGCIVAARLAEDPDAQVCVIEAGAAFEDDPVVIDAIGSGPLVGHAKYDFDYGIVPQARGNSRIRQSRARMLGGCSSHNDSAALRPPPADLAEWERLGASGWGPDAVWPYFDLAMDATRVHRAPGNSPLARAVHEAAGEAGMPDQDLLAPGFGDSDCVGWLNWNEHEGVRRSTAVSYLYPLAGLPANLTVLTETWVERVILDDAGRAVEVATSAGRIRAQREIVLAAGAIDTPRLLMLSGIGPADGLAEAGIELRHELDGVGRHLKDHLEVAIVWEATRDPEPNPGLACENGLFQRTRPDVAGYDLFFHVVPGPYYAPPAIHGHTVPAPEPAFCFVPFLGKPESSGSVRLDPQGRPLIDPAYLSDPGGADERALRAGIESARRLAGETSLRDWVVREVAPGPEVADEAAQLEYLRRTTNTVYHPAGTCRMGAADDRGAVVDPELRVRGLEGLRIADASVFPDMVSVHPCLTVMMVGERAADLIRRSG
jgi:choline dehydrogenase-like flavoprotein